MFGYRGKAPVTSSRPATEQRWRLAEQSGSPRPAARDFPLWRMSATMVCLVTLPLAAHAQFTPPDLSPGSTYRLIFVTPSATSASDTNIADYNAFVNAQAALNAALPGKTTTPGTTWSAIVSTEATNAITNLASVCASSACLNDPIYLVNGPEVAADQAQLFGGSIFHAIDENELGGASNPTGYRSYGENYVWTGSTYQGHTLAGSAMGDGFAGVGYSTATGLGSFVSDSETFYVNNYIQGGNSGRAVNAVCTVSVSHCPVASALPLYAISGQLTVPGLSVATPEPASGTLLLAGCMATGLVRRLRRKLPLAA
jgi:hypothetical protein